MVTRQFVDNNNYHKFGRAVRMESPPLLKNEGKDSYDAIETDSEDEKKGNRKGADNSTDAGDEPLTKKVIIELIICILAFVGRGLCLNSVGPTLIDLRQIASLSIPQAAWIFVSQSTGFLAGSLLAKVIFQEFHNGFALSMCLFSQALFSAFIPAFRSAVVMCLMFIGQGFAIGVVGIGVCSTCIRLGGKKRNGMFLQSAYLGVSIGSVLGPFVARPFLSSLARHTDNHDEEQPRLLNTFMEKNEIGPETTTSMLSGTQVTRNISLLLQNLTDNNVTTGLDERFTPTHVYFYYIIMGLFLCVPASSFFVLFSRSGGTIRNTRLDPSQSESLSLADCTAPLSITIGLIFIQCLLYFGIQDTYSNLLTTFAVLGPLHFTKSKGVYVSSLFWGSMCFGRLNGIWLAKLISPFKMLLIDMIAGSVAATALMFFASHSSGVLWGFTIMLGLSFATINGATVSWAASHLPGSNYILAMIMVGRCTGLLILPTTVTALFRITGPMTLMYAVFLAVVFMIIALSLAQFIAMQFGVNGKLHSKSELRKLKRDNEDKNGLP